MDWPHTLKTFPRRFRITAADLGLPDRQSLGGLIAAGVQSMEGGKQARIVLDRMRYFFTSALRTFEPEAWACPPVHNRAIFENSGKVVPPVESGYWIKQAEENWYELLPKLVFANEAHVQSNVFQRQSVAAWIEKTDKAYAAHLANEEAERRRASRERAIKNSHQGQSADEGTDGSGDATNWKPTSIEEVLKKTQQFLMTHAKARGITGLRNPTREELVQAIAAEHELELVTT